MLLGTAEMSFQVNGWRDLKFDTRLLQVDQSDGRVYDARFRIRTNQITNGDLRASACRALNAVKRKAYVIFVCDTIVDADNMVTDTVEPTGTNGESITGEAISFLSLIGSKSTVGNADGRTWAHEMGHGLGLNHIDNDNNFMSPTRHGNGGKLNGFDISSVQVAAMQATYLTLVNQGL
jgi:hypothetical protein